MCQHVRERRARSVRGGAIGALRVPGSSSDPEQERDHSAAGAGVQQRGRGGKGRGEEAPEIGDVEDAHEVGESRGYPGDGADELDDDGVVELAGRVGGFHPDDDVLRDGEALGLEEVGTPESLQPGPGRRRDHGEGRLSRQGRLEDGVHSATWTSGGSEATEQHQGAFVQGTLEASLQVSFFTFSLLSDEVLLLDYVHFRKQAWLVIARYT